MERNKILLVDPECNCRLVDVDTGFYSWLIEFNKPLVYEYHQPNAKDYLTIAGTKYGTMNIFRQRQRTKGEELSSEIVCCDKEEDIQVLLNGEKCLTSSESIYVNGKSGEIGQKSEDTFLVVRKTYQMKSYSRRHLETRLLWQLNFSSFEAFYPSNKEVCDPVKVFHTLNQHDFYEFCKDFNVKNQSNTPLLEILKWKLQPNEKSSIKLSEKRVSLSKMRYGEFEAVTVGVEELKANGHFSKHVNNLRNLGVHENILDFITAETNGMSDMFAYQIMFTRSLKDYVASMCSPTNNWRTTCEWIKVLRGIINGLQFLHVHDIRHGNLNLENVFVTYNFTAKLAGLANIQLLLNETERWEFLSVDIFEFGKILLSMITGGKKTWDNDPATLEGILETLSHEDEEVKDLLRKVLTDRPKLPEILQHAVFCDWQTRIELLTQVSDFCELKKKEARDTNTTVHEVVRVLDNDVGPTVFGNSWSHLFGNDDILNEASKYRTHDYEYKDLTDLLRIFRNIISHHAEYTKKFKDALGNTKQQTELVFRRKFPKFFMAVREVARKYLEMKFKDHFHHVDPDFIKQRTQIIVYPYI